MVLLAGNREIRIGNSKKCRMMMRFELRLAGRGQKHDCKCFVTALIHCGEKTWI